ncbi:putative Ig domain-containing protein [Mucilaginibacter sp. HMF5004]|uniref:cellulose binding domain-containing protein n=1 Tax=Mucilaginibacter rivuli TaxID=2857527 RepID=UPI001C5E22F0|nr:cellulose binding domain-containing protein [Mucilaginibacter rivuli]MBW4889748.1 putative Ig domain-containing protein [Mucilaginibacter rivuli]
MLFFIALAPATVSAQTGVPFTGYDLALLKANVNTEPWRTGYNALAADSHSQLSYSMHGPFATVTRAPNLNNPAWLDDMIAIHNLAFMYVFTGDSTYARKATNMLDAWAVTNTTWGGGENMLDIGDRVEYFVPAADILRSTFPGWTAANSAHVNNYFRNVLFPTSWVPSPTRDANKGALQTAIAIGIAAYLKDPVLWQQAIDVYRMDAGGGLRNSLPNGEVGDSGRDDHWFEQIQALGWSAEVAWKQGVDMFAEFNNRLLNIGELYSQYSQSPAGTLTFIPFGGYASYWTGWGIGPGYVHRHPFNNIIKGAYALRKGIPTPYTEQIRAKAGEDGFSFLYLKSADTSHATPLTPVIYPADSVRPVSNLTTIDIGNPGIAGNTSYNNGTWTVNSAGTSTSTAFSFNFKKISGDAGLVVKVNSMSLNSGGCGVMLRTSLAPGATFYDIFLKATGGVGNHYQPKAPWWLKIERVGTRIFTYHSQDGVNWTGLGCWYSATGFPTDLYAGFYALSANASAQTTAVFSNVAYSQTTPAGAPDISSATTATATIGAPFSYNIITGAGASSYTAVGLPTGLSLDVTTGIISGTPTTLGQSEITISATNANGTGTASLILNVINNQIPAAPASAAASVVNTTQINLTWAASANATGYAVKRSLTAGGPYTTIQAGVTGTSFTDASPVPEVSNYYVITALTGNLESGTSNEVSASVPPATPGQPVVVTKSNELDVSWNAALGAATYNVKRSTVSGGPYATIANVSATSYNDMNVSNGTPYYYVISSLGQTKEGANSTEAFGVPGSTSSTWNPLATTGSFSQASNWVENATPVNPAIITFSSSADTVLTNDIAALTASRIQFNTDADSYTIAGNAIHLRNDLVNNATTGHTLSMPVVLDTLLSVNTVTSSTVSLTGNISGSGSLLKTGIGYLYISGANTYSGNTTLNGNPQSWPAIYGTIISGTGTGAPSAPTSGPLGTGKIIMNGGALLAGGGAATLYNDIVVNAGKTSYIYEPSDAISLYGKMTGSGTIIQDGNASSAPLHLYGDNSGFTGTFVDKLRSGNNRVRFEAAQAGSAAAYWNLDANGNDCVGLTFTTGTLNFGALSGRGAIRYDGAGGGSPIISVGALNLNTNFSGTITGTINVEKVGTGIQYFTGNHNYSGTTTIKGGKFMFSNNPTSGTFISAITVQSGSLGGGGLSSAPITIGTGSGTGALLEPGDPNIGTLTTTNTLTLKQDATYKAEISTSAATSDKIVAGSVNLINNPKLLIAPVDSLTLATGTSFTIIDNTGTLPITGTFKNLPELSLLKVGNYNFRITYKGGTGNDVVLLDDRTTPVTITSALTDTVLIGRAMTYSITAIQSPNHFSASGLPAGLSIDTLAGVISGTPTQFGTFPVTLIASNGNTTGTATLILTVQSTIVSGVLVAGGDAKDIIEWTPIANLTYNVKRATTSGGPYTTLANNLSTTSYTDATVTNGSTYYYVITSINNTVESANSTEIIAKPNIGQKDYYKFDELSGTKAIDAWGANHAALAAAATRATGISGQALSLNGTANAYATLPNGALSTVNDFTISAWVKLDALATWGRIFDFGTGTTNYMFLAPKGSTGFPRFAITSGGVAEQGINGTAPVTTGAWTNFAVTQAGALAIMYVNGVEVGRNASMTLKPSSLGTTTQTWIGKSQFTADPMLTGTVDDFKVYSRALSATEIAAAVTAVLPAGPTGLTATGTNQVSLSWTALSGATGYNVKRATTSGGPYTTIASNITATSYVDAASTAGGPYYYIVTAIVGSLESLPSAQVAITLVPVAPASVIATSWNGRIDLSWNASSGATGYTISNVTNGVYTPVGTTTALTYSVTGLTNGTPYVYAISANNAVGTGPSSASATATPIGQPIVNTVWAHADIGTVVQTGNAGYAGGMTLYGAGADVWGNADAFHFSYQTLNGDGAIVAHVASLQNYGTTTAISGNAKAGIMMRATLLANSIHTMVDVTPTVGVEFIRRTATAGSSASSSTTGIAAPYWEKLVRSGNTFTAYRSTDGNTWTLVGTAQTITMPASIYVGLAACSHNTAVLSQARFDTISISSAIPKITSSKTAGGVYGSAFIDTIKATNSPYHFSASGLPAGLSMNTGNGIISGSPAAAGTFAVIVSATNATGNSGGLDTLKLVISKLNQSITFNTLPAKLVNNADFTPGATASSGLGITYTSADTSKATIVNGNIHIKGAGIVTITASQAGNAAYLAAASVSQSLTINKVDQTIAFNPLPNKLVTDTDFDAGATASSGLSVNYTSADTNVATIVNGKIHITGAGTTNITANQTGSSIYLPAAPVTQLLTVSKRYQTITFSSLSPKTMADSDFSIGATTNSGLVISYTSSDQSVATIANGIIHITGAGTTTITASQAGNGTYNPAISVSQSLTVNKLDQSITFNTLSAKTVVDSAFSTGATTNSGLQIDYTSSDPTVVTITNGIIHITGAGTTTITASQAGNGTYNPATSVSQSLTINKLNQTITFSALPAKKLGDADVSLNATASSGLPVTYSSSNTSVATIVNGKLHIVGAGISNITVQQAGNQTYVAATATQAFTVASFNIQVQSLDGDNGQLTNNVARPYLKIVNQDSVGVNYSELTMRYWFTAENYAGINTWIDYAQMGNNNVAMRYVQSPDPKTGALGYIEYSFASGAKLNANSNTGVIQSRFANQDWSNLSEADDYSHQNNTANYAVNNHITLYRNGQLIFGTEPATVPVAPHFNVFYQNQNQVANGNSISTYLNINNTGNVAVAYSDLTVRYWFTREGSSPLNLSVDYAKLGSSKISGKFVTVSPAGNGADTYLEMAVNSSAGALYPLSATGNMQYRINKSDWSAFNEANDYSYLVKGAMAENNHITVYYQGQLIYGTEPSAASVTTVKTGTQTNNDVIAPATATAPAAGDHVLIYPNPVSNGQFKVKLTPDLLNKDINLAITDSFGRVLQRNLFHSSDGVLQVSLNQGFAPGVYFVQLNKQTAIRLLIIQ